MTNKSRKTIIAILLLLAVALYFISGTYARYASDFTGEGKVNVAKWAVSVGSKTNTDPEKKFDLILTPESNANVVNGKIAPSYSATGTIDVDLNGTEVAVALKATIGDLSETILNGNDKVSVTAAVETDGESTAGNGTVTEDTGYKIALPSGAAFNETNGKYKVKITVTWENDENNNAIDTTAGGTGGEVKIPVTLKLTQLIKGEQ